SNLTRMQPLDPQARAVLDWIAAARALSTHELTPERARVAYEAGTLEMAGEGEPVGAVAETEIPGPAGPLRLRLYRPDIPHGPLPALVWLHGGGWVVGSLDSHDALCRRLVNRARCVVVAVDYRLAPEHPFPAGLEDCTAAVEWAAEHSAEISAASGLLAVGGDSAGGALAATVARRMRDAGAPLALQVLVYPVTDSRFDWPSYARYPQGYYLLGDDMRWYWDQYAPGDKANPDAAPLRAGDLTGAAGALVLVAGFDPLHDEGVAYAEKLREAGVPVELVEFPGQIHGFVRWLKATDQAATEATDAIAAVLRTAWA
ncbi:MAG: alpha/beta hydrolase, partial [Egibacteraceae bacterium]